MERNSRKERVGIVVSNKMDKTIVVASGGNLRMQITSSHSGSLRKENHVDFRWGSSRLAGETCPPSHQGDPDGLT